MFSRNHVTALSNCKIFYIFKKLHVCSKNALIKHFACYDIPERHYFVLWLRFYAKFYNFFVTTTKIFFAWLNIHFLGRTNQRMTSKQKQAQCCSILLVMCSTASRCMHIVCNIQTYNASVLPSYVLNGAPSPWHPCALS